MPELPEVETVVREIKPYVQGKKFWKFEALNTSTFLPSVQAFEQFIPGKVVQDVRRKGKYIILDLSEDLVMIVHLRMTGMLLFKPSKRLEKFVRGIFTFSDATRLYFPDIRKFGKVWLYHKSEYLQATGMSKLGVDPIVEKFDLILLEELYLKQKGILKNRLLDQSVITGIGNIYADEICFRIGLHPSSRVEKLTRADIERLHEAILHCLKEGIAHNGTTISDFVGTKGDAGKHQDYLQIYGRTGDPCYVCGTSIKKTRVAGRGTYYCVKCQKLKK
jgi:formamidopyrimidine-DNA glycosylase